MLFLALYESPGFGGFREGDGGGMGGRWDGFGGFGMAGGIVRSDQW